MMTGMGHDDVTTVSKPVETKDNQVVFAVACPNCRGEQFRIYRWSAGVWVLKCEGISCSARNKPIDLIEALYQTGGLTPGMRP